MKKLLKFFIFLIVIALYGLTSPSHTFANAEALSSKMMKLKKAQQGDLVLCTTGELDELAKEKAKEQGITAPLIVIETVVLVQKNLEESLLGEIYEKNLIITYGTINYEDFGNCKRIIVVRKENINGIAKIFSNILNGGLPLVIAPNGPSQVTPPAPETSPPTTPTSRRSYF